MDISNQIADIRKSKGITQKAMADSLGMDQGNYSKLEKRGEKMTVEQLQSIANALGVSLGELLGSADRVVEVDKSRVNEMEKRIEELEELLRLLRNSYEKLKNEIEYTAELQFLPDIHFYMILPAIQAGYLNNENSKGYVEIFKDDEGAIEFVLDDEINPHTDFFLFKLLSISQISKLLDKIPPMHEYVFEFLGNTGFLQEEKLEKARIERHNRYFDRDIRF